MKPLSDILPRKPLAHPAQRITPEASAPQQGQTIHIRTPTNKTEERILRLLARLHCWQCPCCSELYPKESDSFFGVCPECWTESECLDETVDFDKVTPHDICRYYQQWSGTTYNALAPNGNRRGERRAPVEHTYLLCLVTWFGPARIKAALAHFRFRKYLPADQLYWTPRGLVPYGAKDAQEIPSDDRKQWAEIHSMIFEPTEGGAE